MVNLKIKSGDPGKFMLSINFFSIQGNRFLLYNFCLYEFCSVLFLIDDGYGVSLNVDFPNKATS